MKTVYENGWSDLENGSLLKEAEQNGYDLLITTDQNLRYQQNLTDRKLAILVLMSTSWPRINAKADEVSESVNNMKQGGYQEVAI
ncbi:MAG: hypothetical protein WA960_00520 [Tunicatimonas sp.]